jgi:hypothetical protein
VDAGGEVHAIEHDDVVRLLALAEILAAARSGDVTGPSGAAIPEARVRAFVAGGLGVDGWPVVAVVAAPRTARAVAPAAAPPPASPPSDGPAEAAATTAKPASPEPRAEAAPSAAEPSVVLACLARLRVASLERLVREARRVDPRATHRTVLAQLASLTARVRWIGREIVAYLEGS